MPLSTVSAEIFYRSKTENMPVFAAGVFVNRNTSALKGLLHPNQQLACFVLLLKIINSTAPSPIDPVLTVQPDHCYIFFSLKNTSKNYFINYHNIIHLSLVRRTRQTLKTIPLIMLSID